MPSGRSPSVSERRECFSPLKSKYHVSYTTDTIAVTCNLRHEKWSDCESDVWSLLLYDVCKGFGSRELQTRRFGRIHSSPPPTKFTTTVGGEGVYTIIFYICVKKAKRTLEDPLKHPRLGRPWTSCPFQGSRDGTKGAGGGWPPCCIMKFLRLAVSRVVIRLHQIIYFNIILYSPVCQAIALGQ